MMDFDLVVFAVAVTDTSTVVKLLAATEVDLYEDQFRCVSRGRAEGTDAAALGTAIAKAWSNAHAHPPNPYKPLNLSSDYLILQNHHAVPIHSSKQHVHSLDCWSRPEMRDVTGKLPVCVHREDEQVTHAQS